MLRRLDLLDGAMMLSDTGVMVFKGQSYTAEQMNDRSTALREAAQYLSCNVDKLAGAEDLARALMVEAREWSDRARRCCDALTPAQRRTYENISEHLKRTGYGPTIVELAVLENVTTGTMAVRIAALIKKGFVKKAPNVRGGLSVVDEPRAGGVGRI
ncbi:LexA family transcriptional regulator [Pseudomonas sp. 460]|uniref:LexA family protein n=1 Tax=Pseudomonas sp. 460 TaxID=2485142 RepID=UPI001404F1CB|nr:hypothetical protein [Pseudomonas sp. 460]